MGIRPPERPAGPAAWPGACSRASHELPCLAVADAPGHAARRTRPDIRCLRAMPRHANWSRPRTALPTS